MKTFQVKLKNGFTMSFNQYGSGKETFLLLHGIPGSSLSWDKVANLLSNSGIKVMVPDLLGFGNSSRPSNISSLWVEAQANSILESLIKLDISKIHLVGHDFGGPISVTFSKLYPDRIKSLTLLATNTFTDTPIPPPLAMIKIPLVGSFWSKIIFSKASLYMMLKQGVGNKKTKLDYRAALGDGQQIYSIATIFATALRELSTRYKFVEESLADLKIPTKVIWGTKDPFFSIKQGRRTAAAIPNAKFIAIEGAGHFLPDEKPEEIAFELKAMLN